MTRKRIFFYDFSIHDLNLNITEYYRFKLPHFKKNESYTDFKLLTEFLNNDKQIIYVKGLFRYEYLKLFTNAIVINLEDIGCPRAEKLEQLYKTSDSIKTIHNLNLYKRWYMKKFIYNDKA
jgi:hypothetical protein